MLARIYLILILFQLCSPTEEHAQLTSLALLAASGSAAPHVRGSNTVTARTDTAFVEQSGFIGGAFASAGRLFSGHSEKQDEYITANSNFAQGTEHLKKSKEEAFSADAAFTAAKGNLKQITEANTKTRKNTESSEALREQKRLLVEQADAAVATIKEGQDDSKSTTEKAVRAVAATEKVEVVKSKEHVVANRVFDVAGKNVDEFKDNVVDLEAKIAAFEATTSAPATTDAAVDPTVAGEFTTVAPEYELIVAAMPKVKRSCFTELSLQITSICILIASTSAADC